MIGIKSIVKHTDLDDGVSMYQIGSNDNTHYIFPIENMKDTLTLLSQDDLNDRFNNILTEMAITFNDKNQDYNSSFFNQVYKFGNTAALIPLSNKVDRIIALGKDNGHVTNMKGHVNESLLDSVMDLAIYSVQYAMYIHQQNALMEGNKDGDTIGY